MRARQRKAGLTTATIVVPRGDVAWFRDVALRRRSRASRSGLNRRVGDQPGAVAQLVPRRSTISTHDIRKLRELLEITAVGLIVERMNPRLARRLEQALDQDLKLDVAASPVRLQRFHLALAELSGDETLLFLLRVALGVTAERSKFPMRSRAVRAAVVARMHRSHARITRALVERDARSAERAVRRYFAELEDWLE